MMCGWLVPDGPPTLYSTPHTEALMAPWADHVVLSFCLGEAKNRPTVGAFAIDVGFSVTKPIADQLKKTAKRFVFPASLGNVAGERARKEENDQRSGDHHVDDGHNGAHTGGGRRNEE